MLVRIATVKMPEATWCLWKNVNPSATGMLPAPNGKRKKRAENKESDPGTSKDIQNIK